MAKLHKILAIVYAGICILNTIIGIWAINHLPKGSIDLISHDYEFATEPMLIFAIGALSWHVIIDFINPNSKYSIWIPTIILIIGSITLYYYTNIELKHLHISNEALQLTYIFCMASGTMGLITILFLWHYNFYKKCKKLNNKSIT